MDFSIPKGMRDFPPDEMRKREYVMSVVKTVFEKYGFLPFETPAIEFQDTLKNKYGEEEKLIWQFEDMGGRKVALRYDLTVPLARYMAMNRNMPKPFKRYQIGRVWRYDQPQKGRYREFWQCDIDSLGSKNSIADAEIIAVVYESLIKLGFKSFEIKINNRKLMDEIYKAIGIPEKEIRDVYVSVDKYDKLGVNGVKKELQKRKIDSKLIEKVLELIQINGKSDYVIKRLIPFVKTMESKIALSETKELFGYLKEFGIEEKYFSFDLSLARGLDYYTSFVFETFVTEPKIGSITGGGRYDELIRLFSGEDVPATGTSLGIERIIDVMTELNMFNLSKSNVKIFVASAKDETRGKALEIATQLRNEGMNIDIDIMGRKLSKQFEYAANLDVLYVIIVGPKDLENERITLRNMENGKETKVEIKNLVEVLKLS